MAHILPRILRVSEQVNVVVRHARKRGQWGDRRTSGWEMKLSSTVSCGEARVGCSGVSLVLEGVRHGHGRVKQVAHARVPVLKGAHTHSVRQIEEQAPQQPV